MLLGELNCVEIVALFAWMRADVPGFTKVSRVQKMSQSSAVASAASAKAELGLLVSACVLGNSVVKLPVTGESRHSHESKTCLLKIAKAVAASNVGRMKFYVLLSF